MRRVFIIVSLAAVGGILGVTACQPAPKSSSQENVTTIEPAPTRIVTVADEPIDREKLLRFVASAASAAVLGRDDRSDQRALDGKPFEVRIRFGCPTNSTEGAAKPSSGVSFDPLARALRVGARPDLTLDDVPAAALAGRTFEAVEGFWIDRPWLLNDGCPVTHGPADDAAATPVSPGQRVGLAQFFSDTDARTGRRDGRAYEAISVLPPGEQISSEGYNLVLFGRLRRLPLGKVIWCQTNDVDAPTACVVSIEIDRVEIEQPNTEQALAEWSR